MARSKTSQPNSKKARPIGQSATGKPTLLLNPKDQVDERGEETFPASDPPARSESPTPATEVDISPARYLGREEMERRKPR